MSGTRESPQQVDPVNHDNLIDPQESNTDELVQSIPNPPINPPSIRKINLVLDLSAFTKGIGNIKRWYNESYISHRSSGDQPTHITLFIPSYTLRQFDYLKKGTSMVATYARQSIRFIDQLFEENQTTKSITPNFQITIQIEGPNDRGPPWNFCQSYQIHKPKIKEFPNFKTKFDSYNPSQRSIEADLKDYSFDRQINDIQYENSQSYKEAAAHSDNFASMPPRLKYLISSCIYKRYIQQHETNNEMEQWKLVSEDPITQIWNRSFGIETFNINEAELLIFQSYNVNRIYNPHTEFTLEDDYKPNSILQETVDTSLYAYRKLKDTPKGKKLKKKTPALAPKQAAPQVAAPPPDEFSRGVVSEYVSEVNGEVIKREDYNSINYAPRVHGELWKPLKKKS